MPTSKHCIHVVYALMLTACTLPTKLAELSEGGEATDSAGTTGGQATGDVPINSGDSGDPGPVTTGGEACTPVTLTRKPVSPNVVLVLDQSGSMANSTGQWDHDADPMTPTVTRWSSLHQVVESIVTEFEGSINFGAHLFPGSEAIADYSAAACVTSPSIDLAVAPDNAEAVLTLLPEESITHLPGGTPTAAGMTTAIAHLKTLDADVPRAIVLVTDGAANCAPSDTNPGIFEVYDASVHTVVDDAFAVDGIPTYVVGVGIQDVISSDDQDGNPDHINTFDKLNELAIEGGKPRNDPDQKFFNTNNQIMLAAALSEIATDALTCIIALDDPPLVPEDTVVVLGETTLAHVDNCGDEDGWVFAHPDGPFDTIELCGAACSGFKIAGEADVTVCLPE